MDTNIDPIFSETARQDLPSSINMQSQPSGPKRWFSPKWFWIIGGIVFLSAVAVIAIVFTRDNGNTPATSDKVGITISGPQELASGNEAEYVITYSNGENADLLNVSLEVFYPSNFRFSAAEPQATSSSGQRFLLPDLRSNRQGEVTVRGKLSGRVGESKTLRVRLHYSLSNFSSDFSADKEFVTVLSQPNLQVEITGPVDVINGQDTTFTVNYSNVSEDAFENVVIALDYPVGYRFGSSTPEPSRNQNTWNIGTLEPGAQGKIDVKGSFTGDPAQEKLVVAELGMNIDNLFAAQVTASVAFKIVASSLSVTQTVTPADSVDLGSNIAYKLNYGNFGTLGMTNVVITAKLEGALIDFSKLKVNDGIITGNTVTWRAATLADLSLLAPNDQGTISFNVPVISNLTSNLVNQTIRGSADIHSDQIQNPVHSSDVEVKVASKIDLFISGSYVSGAMPMQVGQPTVYAITFRLTNLGNDVEDVELIASMPLPSGSWKNVVAPPSEVGNVNFDVNAGRIRWRVGTLPAFAGKYSEARSMTFQLEVTPDSSDQNQTIQLLSNISASGVDTFVAKELSTITVNAYQTSDIEDPAVDNTGGTVQ